MGNYVDSKHKYRQVLDNAWIGGSADAFKNAVVCGGRSLDAYMQRNDDQKFSMNGICYVLNPEENELRPECLTPLANATKRQYVKKPEDSDMLKDRTYFYTYGQAGLSTHIIKGEEEILIGAPGVLDWTGTIVKYKTKDLQNPVIPNPVKTKELNTYSYFGYSLGSGNFKDKRNKTYYVTGAPRAGKRFQGKIYIFDIRTVNVTDSKIVVERELDGDKFGEYYGAALCVMDVNGDGKDDILVGAPRFAQNQYWDQGRLHIHVRKANLTFNNVVTLQGSKTSGAQFGSAVSCLGDIDMDGFNDFAVGAPYEDSGKGVVYVYYGSERIKNAKLQRIPGKDIDLNIMGFGISFSRALDTDGNNYLDFAVGAHVSGHVAVIKSRPVITYEPSLKANVENIGLDAKGFNITTCMKYEGKYAPPTVSTKIVLTLDELYQRVRYVDSKNWNISYDLMLVQGDRSCRNFSVEIEEKRHDFTQPITLKMVYGLNSLEEKIFCKTCPVVNPKNLALRKLEIPYVTECSNNKLCKPDLEVTAEFIDVEFPLTIGTQSSLQIKVAIKNYGEPAFLAYLNMVIPKACNLLRTTLPCKMTADRQLNCFLDNPLTKETKNIFFDIDMKGVPSGTEYLEFRMNAVSLGLEQNLTNNYYTLNLPLNTKVDISLEGRPSQEEIVYWKQNKTVETETFKHIYVFKNLGPSPLLTVNLEFKVPTSVKGAKNVIEIQEIEAQHNSRNLDCLRSDRKWSRRILNISINETQVETTTTKVEVSSEHELCEELNGSCAVENSSKSEIPELKFMLLDTDDLDPTKKKLIIDDKVVVMDCKTKATTCITVSCILDDPIVNQSKATVNFNLIAKFKELESVLDDQDVIHFITRAKATIDSPTNVQEIQENRPEEINVSTVFYGKIKPEKQNLAYVLSIAIGVGILLLVILILIIWKFGFFKRKRPGGKYRAKRLKNEE